jgi:hypothetical protein
MHTPILKSRVVALAALAGGLVYAFCGAIEATQDFKGTHNTIDSTGEYLVTGGFALSLLLTVAAYRALARSAGKPRTGVVAMVPQLVLAGLTTISVIHGEDLSVFNVIAPICLLTWLVASIVIGVALKKTRAVPKVVAIGLPAIMLFTIPLSTIGGPLVTGAFWMAVGGQSLRQEDGVVVARANA